MNLHDKSGKPLKLGQLVDIHIPRIATGFIVAIQDSPLEIPGMGLRPAGVTIRIELDVNAGPQGGVWCYVVQEPPKEAPSISERPS